MALGKHAISTKDLTDTLNVTECRAHGGKPAGYWLYDTTQGMNLSMGAPSVEAALVEALTYYQKRLADVQRNHKELSAKVTAFVDQFKEDDDDDRRW
jgi:hypothetical protein